MEVKITPEVEELKIKVCMAVFRNVNISNKNGHLEKQQGNMPAWMMKRFCAKWI